MTHTRKRLFLAALFFVILAAVSCLLIRPAAVQKLEPLLREAGKEQINGTISWNTLDLDPLYNLKFTDVELKDSRGRAVLKSPSVEVSWTIAGAVSAWIHDEGAAGIIRDVMVASPSLSFYEEADGTWNIQNLIKKQENEPPSVFRGRVLLKDGEAEAVLPSGERYRISRAEGQFSWLNQGRIEAALNGACESAAFSVKADYIDEKNFAAEIRTEDVPLTALRPLLSKLPESAGTVDIRGGTVRVTKAEVHQSGGALRWKADGEVKNASFGAFGYDFTDGAFTLASEEDTMSLKDLHIKVNGQDVNGHGEIFLKEDPEIRGTVRIDDADMGQLFRDSGVAGRLSGVLHFSGPLSDMTADGTASLSDGSVKGMPVKKASLSALLKDKKIEVTAAEVRTDSGRMQGLGTYDLSAGEFRMELTADHMALDPLADELGVSGTVAGTVSASGVWKDGDFYLRSLNGAAEGENVSFDGYRADEVSADFSGQEDKTRVRFAGKGLEGRGIRLDSAAGEAQGSGMTWEIPYLNGTVGGGAFSLRGSYDDGNMNFSAEAGDVESEALAAAAGLDAGGRISLRGHISGTVERPVFDADIRVQNGHFQGAEFTDLNGSLFADGEWVTVRNLEMQTENGRHTLEGRIGLSGDHALAVHEKSEHTRLENLLKLAGLDYPLTGWFENETFIGGTLSAPEISGHFMAWDGSAAGELFQSASADYRVDGNQLKISNGLAYIYDGAAVVNGTVSADSLDLDAAMVDVNIERIFRGLPVAGKVTFRGHLAGSAASPVFSGNASSRRITILGQDIERASAAVSYENQVFSITDGRFRQKNGRFRWSGLVNAETGALRGRMDFTGWNMQDAFQVFGLPAKNIDSAMNGGMMIRGTVDDPRVSFNVTLDGGHLGSVPLGAGRLDMSYANERLTVRECYLPVGNGILAARGFAERNGAVDLTVAANGVDISWLPETAGLDSLSLAGQMTAGINLSGSLENPQADISVTVKDPRYNGIRFDEFSLMGNVSEGMVHIEQLLAVKDPYKAAVRGTMPVSALTRVPDGRNIPFDLDVEFDNADLNALAVMLDSVTSAEGPLKGRLKIAGQWDDPEIYGGVSVQDGQITAETLSEPISNIAGSLVFSGHRADFSAEAGIGGGTASALTRASWDHMKLIGYTGEAHLHAPRLNCVYYKGALDADLLLTEERGYPKVSGTVNVQNTVADIPMSFAEGGSAPDVLMDVNVNVGDSVRLYNSLLYDMTLRGNIHAMGLMSKPAMSGRVDVEKGTIRYLSNEFAVTNGNAVWGGVPDSFLPVVNISANTTVGHYKVSMDLKGPPGGFVFDMHSEPALNDTQIMTLLTLRQAPGSETGDEMTGALFNAGLQMLFSGGVQDILQNTFGLDLISVTSSLGGYYDSGSVDGNDDNYYVKIGKYLFDGFMLTATMGVNNDEESFGFRYDLKSRFGLSAWYNNDHDSYAGIDYQFQF